jgi:regulator of cell morphogenesis and NO signaling
MTGVISGPAVRSLDARWKRTVRISPMTSVIRAVPCACYRGSFEEDLMIPTGTSTVREIVAGDFRAAAVFHKFGIDFCCGGGRSLADACAGRNLRLQDVVDELERTCTSPDDGTPRFDQWEVETLLAYIAGNHHTYVRRVMPSITAHAQKLARAHGPNHPELHEVARVFEAVQQEMNAHMAKEEQVLFPYIAALADATRLNRPLPEAPFGSIDNPIRMMEEEHDAAGAAMAKIRELTDGYVPPPDGCATYRICMKELEAFERDLHIHVHLENNVLFPKARALASPSYA